MLSNILYKIVLFSINTSLPPTAYIKMIDIWLIFSLLKPFVDIIVQTYLETLRVHPDEVKEDDKDDKKGAWENKHVSTVQMDALKYI